MSTTGFVFSDAGYKHSTPPGHPERVERLDAIRNALESAQQDLVSIDPVEANREDLLRVHTAAHVDTIQHTCANNLSYEDPDTWGVIRSRS